MRIVVLIIAVFLLAQTGAAREDSGWAGPDSFFYPVKIWIEKFSLNFVFNNTEKTHGMLNLAEERLREAESVDDNSPAFERAMDEYAGQLEELNNIIKNDTRNETQKINANITEKIENHKKRTEAINSAEKVSIIQQSIIKASSSSGESSVKVRVTNGNVSVETKGGNPVVTKDGGNVTVVSETNNSKQQVIIKSSGNSSASSSVVVHSSSSVISGN